jgi:hypothetical protein
MRRRSFLKSITLGAASTTTPVPALSAIGPLADEKAEQRPLEKVETFSHDSRVLSGMALGGIGAGSIELRKDGMFYNWNIFNNLPKETGPKLNLPEGRGEDPTASNLQGNTCWTGVEWAFASLLLYRGFYSEAMSVIKTVDDRYRKNQLYWSHQEFGGHYFRPMSSWSIINGLLGVSIDREKLRFDPKLKQASFKLFFAAPTGTAHFLRNGSRTILRCLTGILKFSAVEINGQLRGKTVQTGGTDKTPFHANGAFAA